MRVVWISAGLLVVFIVALVVFRDPQPEETPLAATEANAVAENPFVEETSTGTANSKHVELAVLPGKPSESDVSRNETPNEPNTNPVAVNKPSSQPIEGTSASVSKAVLSSTPSTVAKVPVSTTEQSVVAEQAESEKAGKKLGLSMIMLEKERQKNKVAVIVHESNAQEITEKEIKALYLDRMTRWQDGRRVMLFNLPLGDRYRDKFSEAVLKMTALEADREEEKRRELHIKANDVEVKSKNVVVSYVEQYPNAIAYVPLNLVRDKSNVKVILTIP